MGIIIDKKNTVSLKTVKDGEVKEVDKVLINSLDGYYDGDVVDFSREIKNMDDVDMGGWFIFANILNPYVYLKHNGTELTWQTEKPKAVDGSLPDSLVWHFVPNADGQTYTMESRDGYRPQTNSGTSASTHIKVTTGETGLSKVKLENFNGCLKISDYATVTGGKFLNNAYGYGTYGIWWNDPSTLVAYSVSTVEHYPVIKEGIYYTNPLFSFRGLSSTSLPKIDFKLNNKTIEVPIKNGKFSYRIKEPIASLPILVPNDASAKSITSIEFNNKLFDTKDVKSLKETFYRLGVVDMDLSGWNTANVTNMDTTFGNCTKLKNLNLSGWNTANVTNMQGTFRSCQSLEAIDLSSITTESVTLMNSLFNDCVNLKSLDLGHFDFLNVTTLNSMFYNCRTLKSIDATFNTTNKLGDISGMFYYCQALETIDLSAMNTSNVTSMAALFEHCENITSVNLAGWDTSKVTNMSYMFETTPKLKSIDISHFNTENVNNMDRMFQGAGMETLNISHFNTAKVTNMQYMFYYCKGISSLDISSWNTEKVTDMSSMFSNCTKLTTLRLPQIGDGTKNVSTGNIFFGTTSLANIPSCGPIHNTVSFSYCPLTLESAKVILNALSTPYSGAQTLTFKASTLELINADTEALVLCARAKKLGWDIPGIALPDYVFTINPGEAVAGANVAQFGTTEPVTTYEANTPYYVMSTTSPNLDFSSRGIEGGMQIDRSIINLNLSNNPNLSKLIFTRDDVEGTLWINGTNVGIKGVIDKFYSLLSPRTLKVYYDKPFVFDGKAYIPSTAEFNDNYVVFGFGRFDVPRVEEMNNYTAEDVIFEIGIDQDYTENGWVASTYDRPAGTDGWEYWMSDSNYHKDNTISTIRLATVSPEDKTVDIYINSYGESSYDFTRAYALDSTSTIILDTKSYSKAPEGDLSTNYKKVTYTIPGDGETHYIYIDYRKDSSQSSSYDRGFIIFNPEQ